MSKKLQELYDRMISAEAQLTGAKHLIGDFFDIKIDAKETIVNRLNSEWRFDHAERTKLYVHRIKRGTISFTELYEGAAIVGGSENELMVSVENIYGYPLEEKLIILPNSGNLDKFPSITENKRHIPFLDIRVGYSIQAKNIMGRVTSLWDSENGVDVQFFPPGSGEVEGSSKNRWARVRDDDGNYEIVTDKEYLGTLDTTL